MEEQFSNFGAGGALLYGFPTSRFLAVQFPRTESQTQAR